MLFPSEILGNFTVKFSEFHNSENSVKFWRNSVLQNPRGLSVKIPPATSAGQQPTMLACLLYCTAGSSCNTSCNSSPKSDLQAHRRQVGNKLIDLRDREGISGRAAESDLGLNHIPNLCCFPLLVYKILPYSCSWAALGGFASSPRQSVQNGVKIKDSHWHKDFFTMASKGT